MDDNTYSMYDLYIWLSETTNGENYIMEGNNIVYFS